MKKVYGIIAAISTVVAALVASSACVFFIYQPEEPKSLRD
ncbi:MAG: cyclic lactone autoinducer peptide [Clostridiales bacterium]|jgi:AgrD protein|nr:cyclic lactone autoinducer peptide [Clostridiales bacterium]